MALEFRLPDVSGRRCHGLDIALTPSGNQLCHIHRVLPACQQMIRIIQRNETLRMFRGGEDLHRVGNIDGGVARRMHHQQGLSQMGDLAGHRRQRPLAQARIETAVVGGRIEFEALDRQLAARAQRLAATASSFESAIAVDWQGRPRAEPGPFRMPRPG